MNNNKLIHLKFEYQEALNGKKDILYVEKELINLSRIIRNFQNSRESEIKLKLKLHRKIKEVIWKIIKIESEVPKIKSPEIPREESESPQTPMARKGKVETKERGERKVETKKRVEMSIESQISEIQKKLNAIQG